MQLKIFKIGGTILDDASGLKSFLKEFVKIPGPKILVHGGGKLASSIGKRMGVEEQYFEGRRITDETTLELVTMVYGGLINKNLVAQMESMDCPSVGLCGSDGATLYAHKRPKGKVDYGWVGDLEPDRFNLQLLKSLLGSGFTPVFSSLSYNPEGGLFNTNADTIASALGGALSRDYEIEIYFCFDRQGVLDQHGQLIPLLTEPEIQRLIKEEVIRDGMLPKIHNALEALRSGAKSVYILGSDFYKFSEPLTDYYSGTKVILQ